MIASGIKRGTAELAILSVLESGALHGYEISRRIEQETKGALRFTLAASANQGMLKSKELTSCAVPRVTLDFSCDYAGRRP